MRRLLCLAFVLAAFAAPAVAAPPLDAYGALPAIDMVSLSPSGERFALVARDGEARKAFIRKADGTAIAVVPLGAAKVRDIAWAGDDAVVIFVSNTFYMPVAGFPRQEWTAAFTIDLKTNQVRQLFGKSRNMIDAVFGWYGTAEIDGAWVAFAGGVSAEQIRNRGRDAIRPGLYRVDIGAGAYRLVEPSGPGETQWVIDATGQVVARGVFDSKGKVYRIIAGPRNAAPIAVRTPDQGDVSVGLGGLGRTPGSLILREREGDDLVAREVRPGGPDGGEVLMKGDNAARPLVDPDTRLLIGVRRSGGGELFFDPAHQRRVAAARKALPNLELSLISYSRGLGRMVVLTEGLADSGTYWLVDFGRKSVTPIGRVRPEVAPSDVGPMRMVAYKAADGLAMEGLLTLPPAARPRACLSSCYPTADRWCRATARGSTGGPRPSPRGAMPSSSRTIAARWGYGEAFRKAAFGQFGGKMQSDLSDGVAALASEGLIDPKRVCIVGSSYGGYAALAGVTLQRGIYRCAVSTGGISDVSRLVSWVRARHGADQRSSDFLRALTGVSAGQDPVAISPARLAATADAPILLIHGREDTVVPIEQSQLMERALKSAGKPVELVVMDGEDHWLSREATRQTMLRSAVAFVEKNNPAQ